MNNKDKSRIKIQDYLRIVDEEGNVLRKNQQKYPTGNKTSKIEQNHPDMLKYKKR